MLDFERHKTIFLGYITSTNLLGLSPQPQTLLAPMVTVTALLLSAIEGSLCILYIDKQR